MRNPSDNEQAHCRCARAELRDVMLSLRNNPRAQAQNQHRHRRSLSFETAAQLVVTHGNSSASVIAPNSTRNPSQSRDIVGHQGSCELQWNWGSREQSPGGLPCFPHLCIFGLQNQFNYSRGYMLSCNNLCHSRSDTRHYHSWSWLLLLRSSAS